MSKITDAFSHANHDGRLSLVAYLTAGYPNPSETLPLVAAAVEAGADVIELGVPFSDPMGDGPAIQASSQQALKTGMTLARTIETVATIRSAGIRTPIALMGYCNPFLRYGLKRLYDDAAAAGIDGFVVPDLPAHEADEWLDDTSQRGQDMIFFAAPGSSPERVAYTAQRGSGFLYCLATDGVTGVRADLDPRLIDYLERLRATTSLPLAVGFGISQPDHARALKNHADGVIVGSAIVHAIEKAGTPRGRLEAVRGLVASLKDAC